MNLSGSRRLPIVAITTGIIPVRRDLSPSSQIIKVVGNMEFARFAR
jgi:hypothetical protein